ncbi:MAG: hypothetical protein JRI23_10790 [Deltaproteobacteria bacterium]|jgi:hypothetical protein|nr:hypothetical protein [Deltaproteobacteria bacterium]MBW2532164.1 hypothetical protein [Deltaproteobacteria bacterium]
MSKTKGSSKANWIDVDRRIRDRHKFWRGQEVRELDGQLGQLPDLAEQVEIIDIEQPAIATPAGEPAGQGGTDAEGVAGDGAAAEAEASDEAAN